MESDIIEVFKGLYNEEFDTMDKLHSYFIKSGG